MNKKKIKKLLILIAFIFMTIIIGNNKVYAASAKVSVSSTKIEPGEKVTVNVSVSNVEAWNLSLVASGGTLSGTTTATDATGDGEISKTLMSPTFTANKEGTYTITLSGTVTGSDLVKKEVSNATVTITVEKKEEKASSDATLTNLGITPRKYDFTGFEAATTSYSVKVPNEVEKISIYATAKDSKATISGTGSKTLKEGEKTFSIKVTAEDKKTTKTYKITVTRAAKSDTTETKEPTQTPEKTISTDATLKNLGITPSEYDFTGFKAGTTNYDVSVPYEAEKINIYGYANDSNATVAGTGSKKLDVGLNTFTVKVTAEDKKTTKTYTLKITREEEKVEETTETEEVEEETTTEIIGLTKLEIEGLEISPEFSNNIYEYNVTAPNGTTSLDIKTEKSSDDITIDITGNENLQLGENVITLLVYNSKKDETTTYQIITNLEDEIDLTDVNNSMSKVQKELLAKKIIIIGTIIIIIMLIIVFLVQRSKILSKNEFLENNEKIDLSEDETMFERINENTKEVKQKAKKKKGNHFK